MYKKILGALALVFAASLNLTASTNPFLRAYETLQYWGSGDVDGNDTLNFEDVESILRLINDNIFSYTADVNGDEVVDNSDYLSLYNKVSYGIPLDSDWNELNKNQKIQWISKCLSINRRNSHPYMPYYVCVHFSRQFFNNFHGYLKEQPDLLAGKMLFNLPVFVVALSSPYSGLYHSLNAILTGDNPLDGNDWIFIEPQYNTIAVPGNYLFPFNSSLTLSIPKHIYPTVNFPDPEELEINFYLDDSGNFNLVSYKNLDTLSSPKNFSYLAECNPLVLHQSKYKIYERYDQSRNLLICSDTTDNEFVIDSTNNIKLLDAIFANGDIYSMVQVDTKNNNTVQFFVVDTLQKKIKFKSTLFQTSSGGYEILKGKMIRNNSGKIQLFYAIRQNLALKIYHRQYNQIKMKVDGQTLLSDDLDRCYNDYYGNNVKNCRKNIFDACITETKNDLMLVYVNQRIDNWKNILKYRRYCKATNTWSDIIPIDTSKIIGVSCDIFRDTIKLFYWTGNPTTEIHGIYGNLIMKNYFGGWLDTTILDSNSGFVHAISNYNSSVFFTYEKLDSNNNTSAKFGYLKNGSINIDTLTSEDSCEVWYPNAGRYNSVAEIVWSSRKKDVLKGIRSIKIMIY